MINIAGWVDINSPRLGITHMFLIARGFAAVVLAAGCVGTLTLPASGNQNAAAAQVAVYLPDVLVGAGS
jgi:hypothetical protein